MTQYNDKGPTILHSLMPQLHESEPVQTSALHATYPVTNASELSIREAAPRIKRAEAIGHHVLRLDNLMKKGKEVEGRVWKSAVNELVMPAENIPESYWKQQVKLARDNGHGDIDIDYHKDQLAEQLQNTQRTSVESWATYLQQTGDQYPAWFKFYAWDGMSRLGVFDKKKGQYRKRDASTVAPYPQLNPGVLAKVYNAVTASHPEVVSDEDAGLNSKVKELVQNGNFNRLYSHLLLDQKAIIPTPEKPEDVHGQWREYKPEDISALTEAAEGTPWCIAGKETAETYLNKGPFFLFHLEDPETGSLSPTAAASIRIEYDKVVEISGLKGGPNQYVEDALVPEVMAKAKTLPGGEKYIEAFEDKQRLIAMDRKFQHQPREDFTLEEIEFLYEIHKKITYIDTYAPDPRPKEFKRYRLHHRDQLAKIHGDEYAQFVIMDSDDVARRIDELIGAGLDATKIAHKLPLNSIVGNLDKLLAAGANVDELVSELDSSDIVGSLDKLLAAGATIDELVNRIDSEAIVYDLDKLLAAGATIDIDRLASGPDSEAVVYNLDKLLAAGANVNIDELVNKIDSEAVVYNLDKLLAAGAVIDELVSELSPDAIANNLDKLLTAGANVNQLVSELNPRTIANNLDKLLTAGAVIDVNQLVSELSPDGIANRLNKLLTAGATIDVNQLVSELNPRTIANNLDKLLTAGATIDINQLVSELNPKVIALRLDKLLTAGATIDVNQLVSELRPSAITFMLDKLLAAGVTIDQLVSELDSEAVANKLDKLLAAGANVNQLVSKLDASAIANNLDKLLAAGANPNVLDKYI